MKEDPRKFYKEIEIAGRGGFGRVFYATKTDGSNFRVAIKKMEHIKPSEKRHNVDEVLALRDLRHSNIVQYIASYRLRDEIWIVMEFLEGGTLEQALLSNQFTEVQIAYIVKEILCALVFMHSKKWAHRDLKSSNIMMSISGYVKLIDLGLSCDMSDGPKTQALGSPFWMPPEMVLRKSHYLSADIWSFGIVLLEMTNGSPPNRHSSVKALYEIITKKPPTLADPNKWSSDLKDFISQMLIQDPDKRQSSEKLAELPWLKTAALRKDMGKLFQRIFMVKTLDTMGLGF